MKLDKETCKATILPEGDLKERKTRKSLARPKHGQAEKKSAVSAATLGGALVLLATSCTALSSGASRTRPAVQLLRSSRRHNLRHANVVIGQPSSCNTALSYRISDDEQLVYQQFSNDRAVASALSTLSPSSQVRHRNQKHGDKSKGYERQLDMDEYLEYLERRYSRICENETPSKLRKVSRKMVLSVSAWNVKLSPLAHTRPAVEEDPLYALGLLDLASARLLQKLHLPVPEHLKQGSHANARSLYNYGVLVRSHVRRLRNKLNLSRLVCLKEVLGSLQPGELVRTALFFFIAFINFIPSLVPKPTLGVFSPFLQRDVGRWC